MEPQAEILRAAELTLLRLALQCVDQTLANLRPRKQKSFPEMASLYNERAELTRLIQAAMLSSGDKHELDVFYRITNARLIRVPAASGREWGA